MKLPHSWRCRRWSPPPFGGRTHPRETPSHTSVARDTIKRGWADYEIWLERADANDAVVGLDFHHGQTVEAETVALFRIAAVS